MEKSDSLSSGRKVIVDGIDNADRISKLPNDILVQILSHLSTEETIRTSVLSKRWEHVWKQMSTLFFDMRKVININGIVLPGLLDRGAALITKLINNHNGHLATCVIFHYSYQCEDGRLKSWIQLLTDVKHTKNLILAHFFDELEPNLEAIVLNLSPEAFSHPNLTTLSLSQYVLKDTHAFNNCRNLKRLELLTIFAEIDVFNKVISSCPSLEVLVLQIFFYNPSGHLKINNEKLKILGMFCNEIDGIEVFATDLYILSIECILCWSDNVVLQVPRLGQFSRNYWVVQGTFPHTSYNISCHADQEEEGSEIMVKWPRNFVRRPASLSVSVNLKNPREVEFLRETLSAWAEKMIELEILFTNNNGLEEEDDGECSNGGGTQNSLWEKAKPFPNAEFRVDTVWMYNSSGCNKQEFALASLFVLQNTVLKKMMIQTSSFPETKKLEIEGEVAKLKELPKGNEEFRIECF